MTRKDVNAWLVARKIGQHVVSVRFNKRRRVYRAFLCFYYKGANILEFVPYQIGFNVELITTRNNKEEYLDSIEVRA